MKEETTMYEGKMVRTIKMFDGIKLTTDEEVKKYPDMTVFDEAINCTKEQRSDIIRLLLICHTVDLGQYTEPKRRCILDLYSEGRD